MIQAVEVKAGMIVEMEKELFRVVSYQHQKFQQRRPVVTLKLKNIKTGGTLERKFSSDDQLELAHVDRQEMEFLYAGGGNLVFMNPKTYEQIEVPEDMLEGQKGFLKANLLVEVSSRDGAPLSVELPSSVELKVTYTEPSIKKATATNVYKTAKLETGMELQVPGFIEIGNVLKVDTRTGEYISRA